MHGADLPRSTRLELNGAARMAFFWRLSTLGDSEPVFQLRGALVGLLSSTVVARGSGGIAPTATAHTCGM